MTAPIVTHRNRVPYNPSGMVCDGDSYALNHIPGWVAAGQLWERIAEATPKVLGPGHGRLARFH